MSEQAACAVEVAIDDVTLPSRAEAPVDRRAQARAAILAGPILPTLTKLALPTLSVLVAQTGVNIAEGYFVGFLGTDALAGVALVFPVFMLMATMSNGGLGSGVASAVARAIGAGRQRDADALIFHALVLAIFVGAIFSIAALCGGPALYHALGGRDGALAAALQYSNILFTGAIAAWIVNLFAAALRGAGNVKIPALVIFIGAVVTIALSPAFIFGIGPIPALGIAGAGVAFNVYYVGAALVLLRYMASGRSGLRLRPARLDGRLILDILKVGVPTALTAVLTNLTVILVTGAIGLFGTNALAAYGIASRLDYVLIPILFGLSSAVLTMVGINMGARQIARARKIAWISILVGVGITGAIGLVVAVAPNLWLNLYSHDPNVVGPAESYLRIVAPAYAAFGFGFVVAFAAQGAGHTLWPFFAVLTRALIAGGLSWIAVAYFGAGMTTIAFIVACAFVASAAISSIAMLRRSVWQA